MNENKVYQIMKVYDIDYIPNLVRDCCYKIEHYNNKYLTIKVNYGTSDDEFPNNLDLISRWLLKNGATENETILILF
jgi:hypothetical protein